MDCCENYAGWSRKFLSKTANICINKHIDYNLEDYDDTVIHEWLHTCGYHEQDDDDGDGEYDRPPYGDGI